MASSLGSLVVSLGLDAAEFVSGLTKSEYEARKFSQRLEKNIAAGIIKAEVAMRAFGTAAKTAANVFQSLTVDAAQYKDLEETTGASAESLASLAVAGATAGVTMDSIGGAANKLTKNLVGVDDESKAAGAALEALNIDIKAFKQLDPAAQYEALGKAFAGFEDGASKAAVAQALFGKSGAEQLKVFKALEEQGGRTKILTQEQIEQADAYADAQAKATAEIRLYAQAAATQALPALSDLTKATSDYVKELIGVDKATGQLAANNAVTKFAEDGVRALAQLVDIADTVARSFVAAGTLIGATVGAAVLLATGKFKEAWQESKRWAADTEKLFADRLKLEDRLNNQRGNARIADSLGLGAIGEPGPRKALNFSGAVKDGPSAKASVDRVAEAIKSLNREIEVFGQDGDTLARTLAFKDLTPTIAQLEQYKAGLASLEQLRAAEAVQKMLDALAEERDALALSKAQITARDLALKGATGAQIEHALETIKATDAMREQNAMVEEGKRLTEQLRTPLEVLTQEYDRLNKLLAAGAIDATTYRRAVESAQDAFNEVGKQAEKATSEIDRFAANAAENIQRGLGDTLVEAMNGNWKSIGDGFKQMLDRMIAEALAAQIVRSLFGDSGKGGGLLGNALPALGNLLGFGGKGGYGLPGSFAGLFAGGGDIGAGRWGIVGDKGPEIVRGPAHVIPNNRSMQMLRNASGSQRAPATVVQHFHFSSPTERRTQNQVGAEALRGLTAARRNG